MVDTMPFGRHAGRALDEIPADYLAWLAGRIKPGSLRRALVAELQRRGVPVQADPPRPEPTCDRCHGGGLRYTWQTDALGRQHIRRECARCKRFLGFAAVELYAAQANAAEEAAGAEGK
jgi:uncharacterized protein (DUF3820 family)